MESRKKLKSGKNDDEASTPRTSALNSTAVNESSSRDQDSRRILRDEDEQRAPSTEAEGSISTAMVAATSNQASSYQLQPRFDSLNQPGSNSNSVTDQAKSYQLLQQFDSLYLSTGSYSQQGLMLQPFDLYDSQLGYVSTADLAPQWNILSRSDGAQQNPLLPQTNLEPHTQFIKSQPSSPTNFGLQKYWDKMLEPIESGLKAQTQSENNGDSDNAKVPSDLLTTGKSIKAGAGEVFTVTDTEFGEIQGDKEDADDTSQDSNNPGHSSV